jgi:hypothetical protein
MNLFEMSLISSAIVGAVTGWQASSAGVLFVAGAVALGIVVGLLIYGAVLLPGIVTMKLAPSQGITPSHLSTVAGVLLMAGSVVAPVLTYSLAPLLLGLALSLFS